MDKISQRPKTGQKQIKMRKITVITGPANSGKTFLSKNISLNYENPIFVNERSTRKEPFRFSTIDSTVDLIIIDDVNNLDFFRKLQDLVNSKTLFIKKIGIEEFHTPTPNVIINTSLEPSELSSMYLYNVLSCWRNANGHFIFKKVQDSIIEKDQDSIIK